MLKLKQLAILAIALVTVPVQAEIMGRANGRSANMDLQPDMSVEAGASLGDFQNFGGRFNYKFSPDLVAYADLALVDFNGFDGMGFGFGAYYQLRNVTLLENTDFAVKASYHTADLEENVPFFGTIDVSWSIISVEALISGDQIGDTEFGWYGNIGIHLIDAGSADETELGFGGGIYQDTSFGQFYAGIDFIEEMIFSVGIRYGL